MLIPTLQSHIGCVDIHPLFYNSCSLPIFLDNYLGATFLHPFLEYVYLLVVDSDGSKWSLLADVCPSLRPKCKLMIRLLLGYKVKINYNNKTRCMCDSLTE